MSSDVKKGFALGLGVGLGLIVLGIATGVLAKAF